MSPGKVVASAVRPEDASTLPDAGQSADAGPVTVDAPGGITP